MTPEVQAVMSGFFDELQKLGALSGLTAEEQEEAVHDPSLLQRYGGGLGGAMSGAHFGAEIASHISGSHAAERAITKALIQGQAPTQELLEQASKGHGLKRGLAALGLVGGAVGGHYLAKAIGNRGVAGAQSSQELDKLQQGTNHAPWLGAGAAMLGGMTGVPGGHAIGNALIGAQARGERLRAVDARRKELAGGG